MFICEKTVKDQLFNRVKYKVSVWQSDMLKKKATGGRKKAYRKKRKFELGKFAAETTLGKTRKKKVNGRGSTFKMKVLSTKYACVNDSKSGKTEKTEIIRVIRNPTNIDYNRRNVITSSTIIDTKLGRAKVTSRPGQNGIINAVLLKGLKGQKN
jgi:small subunit ribosomal protein S8e